MLLSTEFPDISTFLNDAIQKKKKKTEALKYFSTMDLGKNKPSCVKKMNWGVRGDVTQGCNSQQIPS